MGNAVTADKKNAHRKAVCAQESMTEEERAQVAHEKPVSWDKKLKNTEKKGVLLTILM